MMESANRRRKRPLRGRRLVVVDIENVVGGAVKDVEQARSARIGVALTVDLQCDDQAVVGTSHIGLMPAGLGWPGARLVMQSGPDGADLALLEVLTTERLEQRFDEVVLVSGDGIFADAVACLAGHGVSVTVVSRINACSKRLRMAATRTLFLDQRALGMGDAA